MVMGLREVCTIVCTKFARRRPPAPPWRLLLSGGRWLFRNRHGQRTRRRGFFSVTPERAIPLLRRRRSGASGMRRGGSDRKFRGMGLPRGILRDGRVFKIRHGRLSVHPVASPFRAGAAPLSSLQPGLTSQVCLYTRRLHPPRMAASLQVARAVMLLKAQASFKQDPRPPRASAHRTVSLFAWVLGPTAAAPALGEAGESPVGRMAIGCSLTTPEQSVARGDPLSTSRGGEFRRGIISRNRHETTNGIAGLSGLLRLVGLMDVVGGQGH